MQILSTCTVHKISKSFPQVSPLKPCMRLSSPHYVLHDLPISVLLSWSEHSLVTSKYPPVHPILGNPQHTFLPVVSLCSPVCSGNFSVTAVTQVVYTVCSRRDVESHPQVRRSTASPLELPADGSVQKLGEWLEATKEAWRTVVSLSVIRHDVMALYAGVATSVVLFVVLDAGRYVIPLRLRQCWGVFNTCEVSVFGCTFFFRQTALSFS
jgi:hypothetical protein